MGKYFDEKSKFIDVYNHKALLKIRDALFISNLLDPNVLNNWYIKEFGENSHDDCIAYYDFLVDRCLNNEAEIINFYSNEEKSLDISKKDTFMLYINNPNSNKVAIIIPGGGYNAVCSYQEGYTFAYEFYKRGYSAFIIHYRVAPYAKMPNPLDDLASAIKYIIKNYPRYDMDNYLMIGSSAGGHLAASFSLKNVGYKRYNLPKPKYLCLVYPVIDMSENAHVGSKINILGENPSNEDMENYSVHKNVDKDYPITYLWQGDKDDTVPLINSQIMDEALTKNNVKHVYKIFEGIGHGWATCAYTDKANWMSEMIDYFEGEIIL